MKGIISLIIIFFTILGILVVMTAGDEPAQVILWLLTGTFRSSLAFGNMLESAARLTIAGLAAALVFRSGLFNLGGEGQALAGGLCAAAMAMTLPTLPVIPAIGLSILAGITAGGIMGMFSGILKARWGVDELMSSFLLSAAMLPAGVALLGGPMKDSESYLIAAPPLPPAYRLPLWLPPSRLGPILPWALLISLATVLFISYTRLGYEWRLRGANSKFAAYCGIRTGRIAFLSMTLSGSLFGLAGTTALLDGGQAVQGFTAGLGWNGLAVALIAGSRPRFVPLAALAYAWLENGTQSAMMQTGFPFELTGLIQAVVFLLVTVGEQRVRRSPP